MYVRLRSSSAATLRWHLECEKLVPPREIFVESLDAIPETDARDQQVGKEETELRFLRMKPISSRHMEKN